MKYNKSKYSRIFEYIKRDSKIEKMDMAKMTHR